MVANGWDVMNERSGKPAGVLQSQILEHLYDPRISLLDILREFDEMIANNSSMQQVTRCLLRLTNTVYSQRINQRLSIYSFILKYDPENVLVKSELTKLFWQYVRANRLNEALKVFSLSLKYMSDDNRSIAFYYKVKKIYLNNGTELRTKFKAMMIRNKMKVST
jgi:hypothetical protein